MDSESLENKSPQPSGPHRTIFAELLSSPILPPSEKTVDRLVNEGFVVMAAGTGTTAWALTVGLYFLLVNPSILSRLRSELEPYSSAPTPATASVLSTLPYLSAVIKESLRLSYGKPGQLPRISPDKAIVLGIHGKRYNIPPGTPVSMTSYVLHQDETIFPQPTEFRPERWLGTNALDKYLVSFNRGTRICIGINLARAELVLGFAALVGSGLEFELYQTTKEDVECKVDAGVTAPGRESKGVRVLVKG